MPPRLLSTLISPFLPWRAELPRDRRPDAAPGASGLAGARPLLLIALLFLLLLTTPSAAVAGDAPPPPAPDLVRRADKIVAVLQLADAPQAARISDLVARQYAALRLVHDARDTGLKLAADIADKTQAEQARNRVKDTATARQNHLHFAYLAALSAELTPAQIEQIKDGMTYGVLPNTYKVYQEMLPHLTTEQKAQLLAWLTEAREHAMDASTSDEKHAWFGKYKGRINNYLSKAGIDLKQAEKEMFARKKSGTK